MLVFKMHSKVILWNHYRILCLVLYSLKASVESFNARVHYNGYDTATVNVVFTDVPTDVPISLVLASYLNGTSKPILSTLLEDSSLDEFTFELHLEKEIKSAKLTARFNIGFGKKCEEITLLIFEYTEEYEDGRHPCLTYCEVPVHFMFMGFTDWSFSGGSL